MKNLGFFLFGMSLSQGVLMSHWSFAYGLLAVAFIILTICHFTEKHSDQKINRTLIARIMDFESKI